MGINIKVRRRTFFDGQIFFGDIFVSEHAQRLLKMASQTVAKWDAS